MAVELVVGPVIAASVGFLLNKIVSSEGSSFLRGKKNSGFDGLLDKLKTTLLSLSEVLGDAEHKQMMRNPKVEEWLDMLKIAVEDAENLFEEIEYDALKHKVDAELKPNKTKVRKFFSSLNSTDKDRKTDMKNLLERLETFKEHMFILHLENRVEKIQSLKPPSISSIEDSEFFGRDYEKNLLKNLLLSEEIGREKICVIPIVGLGGIGKTTLAQAVYNDDEVKKHFEHKTWVCVSDEFDVCKVMKNVLESVTRNVSTFESLNVMQEKIQEKLKDKKFLIVLDDVWCETFDLWDTMRVIFKVGAQGSKIIVTTRSQKVASIMGTTSFPHLNELNEEVCLELFVKIVSSNKEFNMVLDLKRIGKEIVQKCKGLPLAVKVIARLLCHTDVKQWERIAKSDVLDFAVREDNTLPAALRLSYHYLPSHLKRCFVYCAIFPKDYQFTKKEMVSLWMIFNLLEKQSSGNKTRDELGNEYFNDLVSRSFFQPCMSSYEGDRFVMHDLIVDLASFVSKEKFIFLDRNKLCGIELIKQARHIVVEGGSHMIFKSISQAACLHTFLCAGRSVQIPDELVQRFVEELLKLKHLRVLCLVCRRVVYELPESIGELRHLRYLRFGYTSSIELPKSFSMLYNLQTLIIDECLNLTKLPKNFHNLISLKHLDIVDCSKLCTLSTLGQLPALETLCIEGCKGIERVGVEFYGTTCTPFASLETLKFDGLENWKEWSMPNAEAFPKLTSLAIQRCGSLLGDLPFHLPSLTELDLLMCSKLCSSLPMMPNVSKVSIKFCRKLIEVLAANIYESFQELSIDLSDSESSIELLHIDSFPNIRTVEVDWYEDVESFLLFQSPINTLSTLSIRGCHNITLLSDNNLCCPNLTQLELSNCRKLRFLFDKLPSVLPCLQELLIVECQELESLPKFGLPLSLRKLKLVGCYKLIAARKKWNLQALSNLISFELGKYKGEDMVSFLEQGFLPTSLTSLTLTHLPYLKTLDDKGFQELTSLKELRLNECPELETLPVKGLPPSFEGTLPPSFKSFFMESCYLLKQKYEWKKEKAYDFGASQSSMMISCVPRPQATISIQSSAHQ